MSDYRKFDGEKYVNLTPAEVAERQAEEAQWQQQNEKYEREVKYKDQRRSLLMTLDGDGMDAMRKALIALANGDPLPAEFTEYLSKVEAIKASIPKPQP